MRVGLLTFVYLFSAPTYLLPCFRSCESWRNTYCVHRRVYKLLAVGRFLRNRHFVHPWDRPYTWRRCPYATKKSLLRIGWELLPQHQLPSLLVGVRVGSPCLNPKRGHLPVLRHDLHKVLAMLIWPLLIGK